MAGLKGAGIALDRKSLAEIAATDDAAFGKLVAGREGGAGERLRSIAGRPRRGAPRHAHG